MGLLERFLSKKGSVRHMVSTTFPRFLGFFEQITMYIYRIRARLTGGVGGRLVHDRPIRRLVETIRIVCL